MDKKYVWLVLIVQVAVLLVAVGTLVFTSEPDKTVYDGGKLIDATGSIVTEEDADAASLAYMLVALADGGNLTVAQVEQLNELLAGLFCSVQMNDCLAERLNGRMLRAEASIARLKEGE